jgi:hypothetical protein
MKIFVKTLKGTSFEIDAKPQDKVLSYFPSDLSSVSVDFD